MAIASRVVCDIRYRHGEGPTWDDRGQVARWIDGIVGHVWESPVAAGQLAPQLVHQAGGPIGAAAPATDDGLLVAAARVLIHLDAQRQPVRRIDVVPDSVNSRLNEGGVDPDGRYLVGSMALDGRKGQERLWRLEHSGALTVIDDDLTTSNGLGWSPGGDVFYSVDSGPRTVWQRSYDPASGAMGARRRLHRFEDANPDGLAMDTEGRLWIAMWAAGEVRCLSPRGVVLDVISTTAPLTTSCTFVGASLSTLLITSAERRGTGWRRLLPRRGAGKLFTADVPATGPPPARWRPG